MPKSTFFNLNIEKREKIENAIKREFSIEDFSKASISNIIEEAEIPRGSFYQYFEDKNDAMRYIIEQYIEKEIEKTINILNESDGNIFVASEKIYDYLIEECNEGKKYANLHKNIFKELRKNNKYILKMGNKYRAKIKTYIKKDILNIENEIDLDYIIKIIMGIIRGEIIEVVNYSITKEKGKNEIKKQIEILKKGMEKKNL